MMTRHRQKGMTGIGWLVVLALIGFFVMLILRIGPVYMTHYSVKMVLESLKEEPLITKKSPAEVKRMVQKRLKVNGVYDMSSKAIKVKRSGGVMTVNITYQEQENMVGNLDILVSFSDQVELVSN